jgi:hypothetical protein
MRLKQIMGAKCHKRFVFRSFPAFLPSLFPFLHCQLDGCCQVIITDAGRHSAEEVECLHMSKQQALLVLRGKRHHKRSS